MPTAYQLKFPLCDISPGLTLSNELINGHGPFSRNGFWSVAHAYLTAPRQKSSLTYHAASWHLQLTGQGESGTDFASFLGHKFGFKTGRVRVQLAVLHWNTDQPVAQQLTKVEWRNSTRNLPLRCSKIRTHALELLCWSTNQVDSRTVNARCYSIRASRP